MTTHSEKVFKLEEALRVLLFLDDEEMCIRLPQECHTLLVSALGGYYNDAVFKNAERVAKERVREVYRDVVLEFIEHHRAIAIAEMHEQIERLKKKGEK